MQKELDDWLDRLSDFAAITKLAGASGNAPKSVPVHESLLPASFAVASYRASMLPLLGDPSEASLQGATGDLARLPISFNPTDDMVQLADQEVSAMSIASLALNLDLNLEPNSGTQDE
jgi:hypothetical protein